MVQSADSTRMTFDDFIQWVPNDGKPYELHHQLA